MSIDYRSKLLSSLESNREFISSLLESKKTQSLNLIKSRTNISDLFQKTQNILKKASEINDIRVCFEGECQVCLSSAGYQCSSCGLGLSELENKIKNLVDRIYFESKTFISLINSSKEYNSYHSAGIAIFDFTEKLLEAVYDPHPTYLPLDISSIKLINKNILENPYLILEAFDELKNYNSKVEIGPYGSFDESAYLKIMENLDCHLNKDSVKKKNHNPTSSIIDINRAYKYGELNLFEVIKQFRNAGVHINDNKPENIFPKAIAYHELFTNLFGNFLDIKSRFGTSTLIIDLAFGWTDYASYSASLLTFCEAKRCLKVAKFESSDRLVEIYVPETEAPYFSKK